MSISLTTVAWQSGRRVQQSPHLIQLDHTVGMSSGVLGTYSMIFATSNIFWLVFDTVDRIEVEITQRMYESFTSPSKFRRS